MRLSAWKRPLLFLAAMALVLGVGPPRAHAQDGPPDPSFSSFWQDATFQSGYIFTINGVPVTNPVVGTNGDYKFGFSSASTPMVLTFSGADPFGGSGTDQITGIDAVYLVANGPQDGKDSVTAIVGSSGAPITAFDSSSQGTWTGGTAPGADFPSYVAGNFGSANFLRQGSGTDPAVGDYSFTNIALSSSATSPVLFGLHLRASNGNTAFILFAPPGAPIPEPAYFQLGGLLALSGLGTAFRKLRKRRNS